MAFDSPPPDCSVLQLSFPSDHILLATINREHAMNSIPMAGHWEGEALWTWFDREPSLRVAVLTGKGPKAFSAGADLAEQMKKRQAGASSSQKPFPPGGFLGVSKRVGRKPIIAAVNGFALGGGFEIALNCDMVVASPTATFGLPEVKVGLYAAAGGLPRLVKNFGMQLAGEIALAGRTLSAQEAKQHGFLRVAESPDSLLGEAIGLANDVASVSPDGLIVSRAGLRQAWETAGVEESAELTDKRWLEALLKGENLRIGLEAFVKKQKPKWVPSKL